MSDCERSLNRSSTIAESESFLVAPWFYLWSCVGVRGVSGYQLTPRFTPINHENSTAVLWLCCGATIVAPS